MATLTTTTIDRGGVEPALTAAAGGGDQFTPSERTYFHVSNGGGGSINVTVAPGQVPLPDLTVTMAAVAVPAGEDRVIGPFPYGVFADSNGYAQVTYSGVTSVTVGVFEVSAP